MERHLGIKDPGYRVFLYVFYVCMIMMGTIAAYGIAAMYDEWSRTGYYVLGEVLVETEVPFENFAKLSTWLFFSGIIGWYCVSRIGWQRTVAGKISPRNMALLQLMLVGFSVICLYEVLWTFSVLNAKIAAGVAGGAVPDIDSLYVAYPDPARPWNLVFATKSFLAAFIVSAHALYLSTRPRKAADAGQGAGRVGL